MNETSDGQIHGNTGTVNQHFGDRITANTYVAGDQTNIYGETATDVAGLDSPYLGLRAFTDAAQFSPDGARIVTRSNDGTARIHWTHIDGVIALARQRAPGELTAQERATYLSDVPARPRR